MCDLNSKAFQWIKIVYAVLQVIVFYFSVFFSYSNFISSSQTCLKAIPDRIVKLDRGVLKLLNNMLSHIKQKCLFGVRDWLQLFLHLHTFCHFSGKINFFSLFFRYSLILLYVCVIKYKYLRNSHYLGQKINCLTIY